MDTPAMDDPPQHRPEDADPLSNVGAVLDDEDPALNWFAAEPDYVEAVDE